MIKFRRLALAPAFALACAAVGAAPALADSTPLSTDAVNAAAVADCQVDPTAPLSLADLNPVVTGESDVVVIPGEITAHVVRAQVNTSLGDVQQCTFAVLHRDAQLARVKYLGTATLALVDSVGGTSYGVSTDVDLGNMGKSAPVDPTTSVDLGGFLTPLANATADPTYQISLDRMAFETVQVGTKGRGHTGNHGHHKGAGAARGHSHHTPRTVSRPVKHNFTVSGTVAVTPPVG